MTMNKDEVFCSVLLEGEHFLALAGVTVLEALNTIRTQTWQNLSKENENNSSNGIKR